LGDNGAWPSSPASPGERFRDNARSSAASRDFPPVVSVVIRSSTVTRYLPSVSSPPFAQEQVPRTTWIFVV